MINKKRGLIIAIPFLIALLYSVYWCVVIDFIEDGFQNWVISEIKNNQADIKFKQITRTGFPFNIGLTVDNFTYSQNKQSMMATAPKIDFNINPFNWYDTDFSFSDGATIVTQQGNKTATIKFKSLAGFMATDILDTQTGFNITIKSINLDLPPSSNKPTRTKMAFDQLALSFNATPALPGVLSQNTVSSWRDAGGIIAVTDTGIQNYPAILSISGDLSLTTENQPNFKGHTILVEGSDLLDKIAQTQKFPEQNIRLVKSFLGSFEKMFPNPDGAGLKIPLTIKGGFASIGPFPFMPIPQIHWAEEQ